MAGLFDFAEENISSGNASTAVYQPLADRIRPTSLEDVLGQEDILGPEKPLRMLMEAGLSGSIILWTGKWATKTPLYHPISTPGLFTPAWAGFYEFSLIFS